MQHEADGVPFIVIENCRGLTRLVLDENQQAKDFFALYRHCFELDPCADVYMLRADCEYTA